MLKVNRTARLQGAMALVASATAELQQLKPHSTCAAEVAAKAKTHKDSAKLTRTRKRVSPRVLATGPKNHRDKSKLKPSGGEAALLFRWLRNG
jgi:hypothetical protein